MNNARLEAALDAFESALGERPNVVAPLDSMSNAAWRVALRDGEAVLRTHTLDFGAPVTSHAREFAIHGFAAANGLAPGIIFSSARAGVIVTDFEYAGAYGKDAFADTSRIARVAERIAVLHGLDLPDSITGYSLVEAADRYIARAGVGGNADTDALADVVAWVEADADPADRVLCHRDLLHANILASEPVQFIDWEFASPGERWFDLAGFAVWQDFDRVQRDVMINAYLGRAPSEAERERLARNAQAFRALCRLWELPAATSGS
ncbi:MAG: phosphotransferase [Pseudomonadota bacterium]